MRFRRKRDQYLLFQYGWPRGKHIHYTKLHVGIHNCRIWIQEDMTDVGLADELVEARVPKEDIVLGFNAPGPYTEFAIA